MPAFIPTACRLLGTHLFDQQMWLWGQDVRYPQDNLLLRYGFEKFVCSSSIKSGSAYLLRKNRTHVILWAFGMYLGHEPWGSIFIKRFQFAPRLADTYQLQQMVWEPAALSHMEAPRLSDRSTLAHLLTFTLKWIAEYESWIQNTQTLEYRQQCVASWHKVQTPADAIVSTWQQLASDLQRHLRAIGKHQSAVL